MELWQLTAAAASSLMARGKFSSMQYTRALLDRLGSVTR
jgi:hypothetical protein